MSYKHCIGNSGNSVSFQKRCPGVFHESTCFRWKCRCSPLKHCVPIPFSVQTMQDRPFRWSCLGESHLSQTPRHVSDNLSVHGHCKGSSCETLSVRKSCPDNSHKCFVCNCYFNSQKSQVLMTWAVQLKAVAFIRDCRTTPTKGNSTAGRAGCFFVTPLLMSML